MASKKRRNAPGQTPPVLRFEVNALAVFVRFFFQVSVSGLGDDENDVFSLFSYVFFVSKKCGKQNEYGRQEEEGAGAMFAI